MTIKNIVAGFRVTGVCPLNRKAIELPFDSPEPTLFESEQLVQSTGIKYIFIQPCSSLSIASRNQPHSYSNA